MPEVRMDPHRGRGARGRVRRFRVLRVIEYVSTFIALFFAAAIIERGDVRIGAALAMLNIGFLILFELAYRRLR
jgi:hypothetical protein